MKEDKKELKIGVTFLSIAAMFLVILDYLVVNGFYSFSKGFLFEEGVKTIYEEVSVDMMFFRGLSFILIAASFALVIPKTSIKQRDKKQKRILLNFILLLPFLVGYIYGYIDDYGYNLILVPIFLILSLYFAGKIFPYLFHKPIEIEEDIFKKLPTSEKIHNGFTLETPKGTIDLPMPHAGILTQGSQRSGKTASVGEPVIYQSIMSGRSAFIYDYKGNQMPLTICAYASWLKAKKKLKGKKVPTFDIISILNPLYLTRKVNPIHVSYLKNYAYAKGICDALLKNLDTSTIDKFDFWAKNGLSIITNTVDFLRENYPKYCTIPHLITFLLQNLEDLLKLLSNDKYIGYRMRAVMSAFEREAGSQIAGIEGSLQTILDSLFTPEIFWALYSEEDDYIDLRINDPSNPRIVVILNNESIPEVLTPILGAITSTVAILINDNEDFHPCLLSFDELPTMYIKDLDLIPATMGSKDVILHILYQEESQIIAKYGKENARKILNMGTQIYFRSNDGESSKKLSEMFGEYDKVRHTQTISESGISQSETTEKRKRVTQDLIETQPIGHACGKIMGAEPNLFYSQIEDGSIHKLLGIDKSKLPSIGIPGIQPYVKTDDKKLAEKVLHSMMKLQFDKVIDEVENIIEPYKQIRLSREKDNSKN